MIGEWVVVGEAPATVLCRAGLSTPVVSGALMLPVLTRVGQIRRPLSAPGLAGAETASVTIDLDNAGGAVTRRFGGRPPVRAVARVMSAQGDELFAGVVTSCSLSDVASMTIEAGLRRPLTDTVPLRTSVVWGGYKDVRPLPVVYGAARLSPVPYTPDGRVFVLADHPVAGVDGVTRDDAPTSAWAFRNGVDSTGQAVAFLELATPLAEGEALAVRLRGKRHAGTGRLLSAPAEILHDLLANVCGCPLPWPAFDRFRSETAKLSLGGVVDDPGRSIRATVDALLMSVGAAWSAGAEDVAMRYPWPAFGRVAVTASPRTVAGVPDATCAHDDIVTVLRVVYDYDHAQGRPRRAMELTAPEAIRDHGRIEREWDAGWLRSPRDAQQLGERVLAWMCRPRWHVRWTQAGLPSTRPGDLARLDHPLMPLAGDHRLLAADIDLDALCVECVAEAPVGDPPRIVTTALSTAFEPLLQSGATVEYRDGMAILTILDDAGQPLASAKVTLDGDVTRITDAAGRVSFKTARGRHVAHVEATGFAPMDIEVTL